MRINGRKTSVRSLRSVPGQPGGRAYSTQQGRSKAKNQLVVDVLSFPGLLFVPPVIHSENMYLLLCLTLYLTVNLLLTVRSD